MFGKKPIDKNAAEPAGQELESKGNYDQRVDNFFKQGKFQEAIDLLNKKKTLFNLKGTDLAAYHHDCASCYWKLEDNEKAITNYTVSIDLLNESKAEPRDIALAYCNRGTARYWADQKEEAMGDYTQAITLDPKNAEPHFMRGRLYWHQKNYANAISDFGNALACSAANPDYHKKIKDKRYYLFHDAFEETTPAFLENFVLEPANWKWTANQKPFEQDKSFWEAESNNWVEVSKSNTMAAIQQLTSKALKFEALFQYIIPETMLGNLAYTKSSSKGFSLKPVINGGTLWNAASQLQDEFKVEDAKLLKDQTRAALQANVKLQEGLAEHFPKLHKKLVDATVLLPFEKLKEQLKLKVSAKALGDMKKDGYLGNGEKAKTAPPAGPAPKETELQVRKPAS